MIRVRHVLTLAFAKLHARKVLLFLTILVSSLLFGTLYAGTFIFSGIQQSMEAYSKEAHNGLYLVKSSPVVANDIYEGNANLRPETIKELKDLHAEYVAKEKQLAKELGITFDESLVKTPLKPSPFVNPALPVDQQLMIDFESPVYNEYIEKRLIEYAKNAKNTDRHLKDIASRYGVRDILPVISSQTLFTNTIYLPDGKENFDYLLKNPTPHSSGFTAYGYAVNSVRNNEYKLYDDALLQNWVLPVNDERKAGGDAIPVVITTKEAVDLFGESLGITKPPASAVEKINWVRGLQQKINGQKYTSCYRNEADRLKVSQAVKDLSDIKANEKNPDYIPPKVIYNLPSEPCGSLTVAKDSRTSREKRDDENRIAMQTRLNTYSEPRRMLLEFQVRGVFDLSESSFSNPRSVEDFANNLFANTLDSGALIPKRIYEAGGAKAKYDEVLFGERLRGDQSKDINTKYGLSENVLSFSSLSSAREFIRNEGCSESEIDCKKLFRLSTFGSNYLLLDDLQKLVKNVLSIALPVALGVAGIITLLTMSRIIIDSRRETAVFRALGAKRGDIGAVYVTYGLIVAILILFTSVVLGIILVAIVQSIYGGSFSEQARVAYGLFASDTSFSFFSVNYLMAIVIGGGILCMGLLAVLLPLLRNLRRNPINDMREE